MIIDKNEDDTADAKRGIEKFGAKCAHFTYDFGILGDSQEAEKLRSLLDTALEGKDVAILINNVAEFQHVEFADASPESIFRASNVNCHAQAILSNYFLRKLTARGPARSALVSVGTNAAEPQNPRYK